MKENVLRLLTTVTAALLMMAQTPSFTASAPLKTVRVGWYVTAGLQNGTTPATLGGYNYEYLCKLAQFGNWKLEFVFGTWGELEQQLIAEKIDMLGDVAKTEARLKKYNYCNYPNGYSQMIMACRPADARFGYNEYDSFNGMVVATVHSEFRRMLLNRTAQEHHFSVTYREYATEQEMFDALDRGQADTALFSNVSVYHGYKILSEWEQNPFYFIVTKSRPDILADLNNAMFLTQISDHVMQQRLYEKYFGENGADSVIGFTKEERDYIASAQPVTVLVSAGEKPLSYVEKEKVCGIIPGYIDLIAKKTGLSFTYVICDKFPDLAKRFCAGDGLIFAQFPNSYYFAQLYNANLLHPYYTLQYGLATRLTKTEKIKTVAVADGKLAIEKKLREKGYIPLFFPTEKECLYAVAERKADAAAISSLAYGQLSYHADFQRIVFNTMPELNIDVCLCISRNAGMLYTIIEKASGTISDQAVQAIVLSNSALKPEYTFIDYLHMNAPLIFLVAFLIALLCFFLLWNIRQRQLTEDLKKAKLEADAATQAKSSFLSCMSHDLRTPLNGITGFTDLAIKENDVGTKNYYLSNIKISAALLEDLVNDTLELSRIESGKMTLQPESVYSDDIIDVIETVIRPSAEKKGICFNADYSQCQHGSVWTDRVKLQEILLNILSNAVKYTQPGGTVTFTIATLDPPVNGCTRRYIVQDTGIGMSAEFQKTMFEPFAQEHRAEARNIAGTGLGLTIVKKIVTLMNGTISVESTEGKGTKITVNLPLQSVKTEEKKRTVSQQTANLAGRKILLCEDNSLNTEIAVILLKENGMSVECAANGKEGVEKFASSAQGYFDAILMDIRMPVMDGHEATKTIRKMNRSDGGLPIIAMTANAFAEDVARAESEGMNGYIVKPFDPAKLLKTLSDAISTYRN